MRSSQHSGSVTPAETGSVDIRGFMGNYNIKVRRRAEVVAEVELTLERDMELSCGYQGDGDMLCA